MGNAIDRIYKAFTTRWLNQRKPTWGQALNSPCHASTIDIKKIQEQNRYGSRER